MNNFAVVFNLICIGIVLLSLLAAASSFIAGKIRKNMRIFHKTVEAIDIILLAYLVMAIIIGQIMVVLSIADVEFNIAALLVPIVLASPILTYLVYKEVKYCTISGLFKH